MPADQPSKHLHDAAAAGTAAANGVKPQEAGRPAPVSHLSVGTLACQPVLLLPTSCGWLGQGANAVVSPLLRRNDCRWDQHTGGPVLLSSSLTELRLAVCDLTLELEAKAGGDLIWASGRQKSHLPFQRDFTSSCLVLHTAAFTAHLDWSTMSSLLSLHWDGSAFSKEPLSLLPQEVMAVFQCTYHQRKETLKATLP